MITGDVIEQLPGKPVVDNQGQEVGPVDDVFTFSGSTDAAAWAAVSVSGTRRPVPLIDATFDGSQVTVPYAADQISSAPNDEDEGGTLRTSAQLLDHYGIADSQIRDDTGNPAAPEGHARDQWDTASRDPRDDSVKADDAAQGHP
jgi:sporulation protein YlmC with PRC-barrel domain